MARLRPPKVKELPLSTTGTGRRGSLKRTASSVRAARCTLRCGSRTPAAASSTRRPSGRLRTGLRPSRGSTGSSCWHSTAARRPRRTRTPFSRARAPSWSASRRGRCRSRSRTLRRMSSIWSTARAACSRRPPPPALYNLATALVLTHRPPPPAALPTPPLTGRPLVCQLRPGRDASNPMDADPDPTHPDPNPAELALIPHGP